MKRLLVAVALLVLPLSSYAFSLDLSNVGGVHMQKLLHTRYVEYADMNFTDNLPIEAASALEFSRKQEYHDNIVRVYRRYPLNERSNLSLPELGAQESIDRSVEVYRSVVSGAKSLRSLVGVQDYAGGKASYLLFPERAIEKVIGEPQFITHDGKVVGIGYYCSVYQEAGPFSYAYRIVRLSPDEKTYMMIHREVFSVREYLSLDEIVRIYDMTDSSKAGYNPEEHARIIAMCDAKAMASKRVQKRVRDFVSEFKRSLVR